jgi:1-acyl-sn-glycerol-3-phosphate acyltransferase
MCAPARGASIGNVIAENTAPGAGTAKAANSDLPPADAFPVGRRASLGFRVARAIFGPVVRSLFRIHVSGRENAPDGPCVLIANHLGWLDSLAILLAFPSTPRIHFLGDPSGLHQHPFQWWVVRRVGGYVPVYHDGNPSGPRLYEHVERCLERGGVVAVFPEGRYGCEEGGLEPFHRGFACFAVSAGVPVLPVALAGTRELWLRKRIEVVIGTPILSRDRDVLELRDAGQAAVTALLPSSSAGGRGPHLLRGALTNLL